MQRFVGLLRGVNVGGNNRLPMADLRALVESLGCSQVVTLIQSGNIVFSAQEPFAAGVLEAAIAAAFRIVTTVVLRTPEGLERALTANPFPSADTARLHVGFMVAGVSPAAAAGLERERFLPDEFVVSGGELYLHLPDGMARTKLPAYLDRQLGRQMTVRNWNTLTRLVELAHA